MTKEELVAILADMFDDWIDGDDPVERCTTLLGVDVVVAFESGAIFRIQVTDMTRGK